jgi:hypothetical protein
MTASAYLNRFREDYEDIGHGPTFCEQKGTTADGAEWGRRMDDDLCDGLVGNFIQYGSRPHFSRSR